MFANHANYKTNLNSIPLKDINKKNIDQQMNKKMTKTLAKLPYPIKLVQEKIA